MIGLYNILHTIANENLFSRILLMPIKSRYIIDVNLDTREIIIPKEKFLGVVEDHFSGVVFFRCARHYGQMDLADTNCIIKYINAVKSIDDPKGESMIYPAQYYDYIPESDQLLIPWFITNSVSKIDGPIQFSINFFKLDDENNKIDYSLNTMPAIGYIQKGLTINEDIVEIDNQNPDSNTLQLILNELNEVKKSYSVYWIDV